MIRYFKNMWLGLWTVFVGMRITFSHLFRPNVTIQYPKERFPIPDGSNGTAVARNRLVMDMELCDGCQRCSRICPVDCIDIKVLQIAKTFEQPKLRNGDKRNAWVPKYEIDFAKCCYCGLCTTVCPTEAIVHTPEFEYSTYNRNEKVKYWLEGEENYDRGLLYSFVNEPEEFFEKKAELLAEYKKQKAAEKAAKAKEAAAKKAAESKEKNDNKKENE